MEKLETLFNIFIYSLPSIIIGLFLFFRLKENSKTSEEQIKGLAKRNEDQDAVLKKNAELMEQLRNEFSYVKQNTKNVVDNRMGDIAVMENRFKDAVRNFDAIQKDKMNEILVDLKVYQAKTEEAIANLERVSNLVHSLLSAAAAAGFEGAAQKKN